MPNNKLIICNINMESVIDSDGLTSQTFEEAMSNKDPEVDLVQKFIDEVMFKSTHSNIKKMSEILLNCCDRLFFDVTPTEKKNETNKNLFINSITMF